MVASLGDSSISNFHTSHGAGSRAYQIQAIRIAYGLSGLFEPDEAERLLETQMGEPVPDLRDPESKPVEATSVEPEVEGEVITADQGKLDDIMSDLGAEYLTSKEFTSDDAPNADDLDPQILSFIDQVVSRARDTGAFSAAQGFAHERFKDDGNALNFCLFRLDEAQAASTAPAA